jgi:predicted DNA-binding transcriptional regulator YafY
MNRTERLAALLLALQEHPHTSAQLAQRFELSKRTILRDVQALSEMGVPVIARDGANGGYSLPDEYKLPPLPLTVHEVVLLKFALATLQTKAAPFGASRDSLLSKLSAALPRAPQLEAAILLDAIDMRRLRPDAATPHLEGLLGAIVNRRWVRIGYRSAQRESVQTVFPARVYADDGAWFFDAYSRERTGHRRYRVDRVHTLEIAAEVVDPPPPETPYDDQAHPRVRARLTAHGRVYAESNRDLRDLLHTDATGAAMLDFRCPPSELPYYARLLAGFGDTVEVHEPAELRDLLRGLGEQLLAHYPGAQR